MAGTEATGSPWGTQATSQPVSAAPGSQVMVASSAVWLMRVRPVGVGQAAVVVKMRGADHAPVSDEQ